MDEKLSLSKLETCNASNQARIRSPADRYSLKAVLACHRGCRGAGQCICDLHPECGCGPVHPSTAPGGEGRLQEHTAEARCPARSQPPSQWVLPVGSSCLCLSTRAAMCGQGPDTVLPVPPSPQSSSAPGQRASQEELWSCGFWKTLPWPRSLAESLSLQALLPSLPWHFLFTLRGALQI